MTGLVSGLKTGANIIAVTVRDGRSGGARLTLVNHPVVGPVFSGPHEQPFICETANFKLRSGETLGNPLDANCSIKTRVDYYYRSTQGGPLKPLTAPSAAPPDVAQTTTLDGTQVPYVVRIETGTINRAIYQVSLLHNPASEQAPDPWTRPKGWNRRLIYTHGGGCTTGWNRQGATTGGVDDNMMLRQGYAVASASLNVFGNNCNDLLASETMMMVKERFIEGYGAPEVHDRLGLLGRVLSAAADRRQLSWPARRHHSVPHLPGRRLQHDADDYRRPSAQQLLQLTGNDPRSPKIRSARWSGSSRWRQWCRLTRTAPAASTSRSSARRYSR